jgi:hypothetical protein
VLRWVNNRVLVREPSLPEVLAALAAGRAYGVFAVFGEPGPFDFWAIAAGTRLEMGSSAPAAGAVIHARLPDRPLPELGAQWSAAEAARAELRAVLWRTTATGKAPVAEWSTFGATLELTAPGPGAYSLEIWLRPRHLEAALSSAHSLAAQEYRWILSNAVVLR